MPDNAASNFNRIPRSNLFKLAFDIERKPETDGKHETAVLQLSSMYSAVVFHLSALPRLEAR